MVVRKSRTTQEETIVDSIPDPTESTNTVETAPEEHIPEVVKSEEEHYEHSPNSSPNSPPSMTHMGTVEERVEVKPVVVKNKRRNVQRFGG